MSEAVDQAVPRETGLPPFAITRSFRSKLMGGLAALSLANICLVGAWFPLLYDADHGYFNKLPVTQASLFAVLFNLSWLALLFWSATRVYRRFRNPSLRFCLDLALLATIVLPFDFIRSKVFEINDYQLITFFARPLVLVGTMTALALIVWQHRRCARWFMLLTVFLSPLALFSVCKILLLSCGVTHLSQDTGISRPASTIARHTSQPRVVWLLFDEMDYRLAFAERPDRLRLPEFERLRSEALAASHAYPPGDATELSLPALLSGRSLSASKIKSASDLTLTLSDTNQIVDWSKLPSVFESARTLGAATALVGWYHPYDRVLGSQLDYCAWFPHPGLEPARAATFSSAVGKQLGCLAGAFYNRALYIELCHQIVSEGLSVVTNSAYDLVFLHLPMPHKPAVYLPEKGSFTIWGVPKKYGYLSNLALADRSLGKLRTALENTGQWDKVWFIVSSDHSWRESRIYDNVRDLRVPFLVKAPGMNVAVDYSLKFNTVLTHDLVLAVFHGELRRQEDLVPWLQSHGALRAPSANSNRAD